MGRQVPRLAEAAGFAVLSVLNAAPVFRDPVTAEQVFELRRTTGRAVEAGRLDRDAARRWLDHLDRGPVMVTASFIVVLAQAAPGAVRQPVPRPLAPPPAIRMSPGGGTSVR